MATPSQRVSTTIRISSLFLLLPILLSFLHKSFVKALSRTPCLIKIYYDSSNVLHRCPSYHPEQPLRISVCVERLKQEQSGYYELYDVSSSLTFDELKISRSILSQVHSEEYVHKLEHKCRTSREARLAQGKDPLGFIGYVDEGDTYVTTESYDVCLRATAIWIRAVHHVLHQQQQQQQTTPPISLALTRPPGHHATKNLANGFCIFNFCASAVLHAIHVLRQQPNPTTKNNPRVSVLDWDVHYGQGTADILQHIPEVRYVSIHQTPAFPYMGQTRSISGPHKNIFTIPIVAETSWEGGYKDRYENLALPFIANEEDWLPDIIIISAGYDALDSDPLASVSLNPNDYEKMVHSLHRHLARCFQGKQQLPAIVLGLEGGYQLQKDGNGLDEAVLATVKALVDITVSSTEDSHH